MKSPSPRIKESASAQRLLHLEGRALREICPGHRFGIQSRGLPKWEVLQVICFADWGRSLELGLKRLSWGLGAGLPAGIIPPAG